MLLLRPKQGSYKPQRGAGLVSMTNLTVADFQIMKRVSLQHPVQSLLPLLKAKLWVLGEGAVDITADDLVHLLLSYADLQQGVVFGALGELKGDGPVHCHDCIHQTYST